MEIVLVRSKDPKGVLIVFHGCMRRPTDWWHYDLACVTCIGQPSLPRHNCNACADGPGHLRLRNITSYCGCLDAFGRSKIRQPLAKG